MARGVKEGTNFYLMNRDALFPRPSFSLKNLAQKLVRDFGKNTIQAIHLLSMNQSETHETESSVSGSNFHE